jgi:hypothetical protein
VTDPILRVVKWDEIYENNRTRELKAMEWVPIPNKMDGDGYTELLDHPNGAAHFGVWIALVEIASKCKPRGTLLRKIPQEGAVIPQEGADGFFAAHNSGSLARISRIPRALFDEAIPRLKVIGWIEYITPHQAFTKIPQEGAVIPQEGASSRARSARFPSLPFPSLPEEGLGETKTHQNGKTSNLPDGDIRDWFERQYARHPRKRDKVLAEREIVEHLRLGKTTMAECERVHIAWCESEGWRWKHGAAVKQTYAQWISDEGYRYMPNGHAKPEAGPETAAQVLEREARQSEADDAARIKQRATKAAPKETA